MKMLSFRGAKQNRQSREAKVSISRGTIKNDGVKCTVLGHSQAETVVLWPRHGCSKVECPIAIAYRPVDNLVAIIDANDSQVDGAVSWVTTIECSYLNLRHFRLSRDTASQSGRLQLKIDNRWGEVNRTANIDRSILIHR
jgi:hypothetical protein